MFRQSGFTAYSVCRSSASLDPAYFMRHLRGIWVSKTKQPRVVDSGLFEKREGADSITADLTAVESRPEEAQQAPGRGSSLELVRNPEPERTAAR